MKCCILVASELLAGEAPGTLTMLYVADMSSFITVTLNKTVFRSSFETGYSMRKF